MQIDRPITIALIIFVIILLIFFLVVPEYKKFTALRSELGEKKAEYNAMRDYYAEIVKVYYALKNHEDDIKKIDSALPEEPELGKIIYFIEKNAADSGMIVKDLFLSKISNAKPGTKDTSARDIVFSVDLLGEYSSLGNFINSLEKSSRIFEVSNISFKSGTQVEASARLRTDRAYSFNLQIKTHSY